MIKTISYDQHEIITNILKLFCPNGIELDPTYSIGNFYKKGVPQPIVKSDLYPKVSGVFKYNANNLPHFDESIESIIFDPPFIVGTGSEIKGKIGKRFHMFKTIKDMYSWYVECIIEFNRILKPKGILIFKCQDTVSSNK